MDRKDALINLLEKMVEIKNALTAKAGAELGRNGTYETWSPKDMFGHIIEWFAKDLQHIKDFPAVVPSLDVHSLDELNIPIFEKYKSLSWAEIDKLFEETYTEAITMVRTTSHLEENLVRSNGSESPIWRTIAGHGYSHPLSHIADYYRKSGDVQTAIQLWENSIVDQALVGTEDAWIGDGHYNLACIFALCGETEKAIVSLTQALSLNPKLSEHSKTDTDLQSIRSEAGYRALYEG